MSAYQQERIRQLKAEIAELKRYKRQAIRLMWRNDELLNQLKVRPLTEIDVRLNELKRFHRTLALKQLLNPPIDWWFDERYADLEAQKEAA